MLAAALLFCLLARPVLGRPPGPGDEHGRVLSVLGEAASRTTTTLEELQRELSRGGPTAMGPLLEILASGEVAGRALSSLEEGALQGALVSFGAPPVRALAELRLAHQPSPEEDCVLLDALGRVGSGNDLALVRRVAESAGPAASRSGSLEGAITALLQRDPSGLETVRRWILQAPEELDAALVSATGKSECSGALPLLAALLGLRTELDPLLLPEIGQLAAQAQKPIDEDVLAQVERSLEDSDPLVLREAALALGQAEAPGAVPRLIELLEHQDRGVSTAALRALESITGLRLREDVGRWRAWLTAETRWFEAESPRLLGELESPSQEIAVRALGELSCHRMHRQQLALAAAPVLQHPSPAVRRLACAALAHLGTRAAVPALFTALGDEDEGVAEAAGRALEALGSAPPSDPEAPRD